MKKGSGSRPPPRYSLGTRHSALSTRHSKTKVPHRGGNRCGTTPGDVCSRSGRALTPRRAQPLDRTNTPCDSPARKPISFPPPTPLPRRLYRLGHRQSSLCCTQATPRLVMSLRPKAFPPSTNAPPHLSPLASRPLASRPLAFRSFSHSTKLPPCPPNPTASSSPSTSSPH